MYCTACGNQNSDGARFCTNCGQSLAPPQSPPPPQYRAPSYAPPPGPPRVPIPNYLVQAILVTFFCCLPAGVVSIVFAAQVNGKLERGDIEGARRDSNNAKTWAWISFGLALAGIVFYLFFWVVIGISLL